jgi:hypothetical protein
MEKAALLLSLAVLFSLSGCVSKSVEYVCSDWSVVSDPSLCPDDAKGIVCSKPYIRVGTGCCLDRNENGICDGDEGLSDMTPTTLDYRLEVKNKERRNLTISDISAKDVDERKNLEFSAHFSNTGNVELYPKIHIDLLEKGGNESDILKSIDFSNKMIPPMSEKDIEITVADDLLPGEYLVRFIAYLDNNTLTDSRLSFTVRRDPSVPQGRLVIVEVDKVWAVPGDTVNVTAVYRNEGFVSVPVVFKGRAVWDDNNIAVLTSDELTVPSGEEGALIVKFTPQYPGRYILTGNVYYAGKVSAEKSTILNVKNQ